MAQITNDTKTFLKNAGARFNRYPTSEKVINSGILALAKQAIGNTIQDDEPYTIRINFQNGRIVGSEAQPRLSVELLDGRATTSEIGVLNTNSEVFIEYKSLVANGYAPITNEGSWVARAKLDGNTVKTVFVSRDFGEEDRELIKTALMRGFDAPIRM